MKSKVRLEKYINFSLISNCIIFNALAGCGKGKDNKGSKGCSGSGKDKDPIIINNEQQSAEELAKKQKEAEEKEKKAKEDKEKAEKLAKDKAALDKKKQELINVINVLEPRITKINTSGYNDLKINDIITKDQINLADAKTIVNLEDKINKLNDKITKNEETLAKYEELKKKKEEDFIPKFNKLKEKMDIINNLNGCIIKVDTTIITKKMIDDSKYEDIASITQKLTNLETEINTKFTAVKNDLKTKNSEVNKQISNTSNPLHDALKVSYNDKQIEDCTFVNLEEIYNDVKINYDLSQLSPEEAKKYIKDEFKKINNLYNFFVSVATSSKTELENYFTNINNIDLYTGNPLTNNHLSSAVSNLKNLQNKIKSLCIEYNNNYKKRYDNAIAINDKLSINFIYEVTIENLTDSSSTIYTVYNYKHSDKVEKNELIKIDLIINEDKTVEALNAIEENIKALEKAVNNGETAFNANIKDTLAFFKNAYGDISNEIKNYKLNETNLDEMINSIKVLYELVRKKVQELLKNADNVTTGGVNITDELKNTLKELKLYDDSDDIKAINTTYTAVNNFFDSENKDATKISKALKTLKDELEKCNIIEQRRKIYNRLKGVIDKYMRSIPSTILKYCSIKKNKEGLYILDRFCYNLDDINNYINDKEIKESLLSVYDNIPELKEKYFYFIEKCSEFDKNMKFEDIEKYLKNFEQIFNHNAEILGKIKLYFNERLTEIKKINYILNKPNFKFMMFEDNIIKDYPELLKVNIDDCFDIYLNLKKFIIDIDTESKKLSKLDLLIQDLSDNISYNILLKNVYKLYFGSKNSDIDGKNDEKDIIELKYVFINIEVFKYLIYAVYLVRGGNAVKRDNFIGKIEKNEKFHIDNYFKRLQKGNSEGKRVEDVDYYKYTHVTLPDNPGIVFTKKLSDEETIGYILFNEFYKFFNESEKEFFDCDLLDKKHLNYKK